MVNSAALGTQDGNDADSDDPDPAYFIDVSTYERSGKSFSYALKSRLCETCPGCEANAGDEPKELRTPSELMRHICSRQPDYLLSSTPITELLVANSNRPMKLSKIQSDLSSAWASVIYLKNLSDTVVKRMLAVFCRLLVANSNRPMKRLSQDSAPDLSPARSSKAWARRRSISRTGSPTPSRQENAPIGLRQPNEYFIARSKK